MAAAVAVSLLIPAGCGDLTTPPAKEPPPAPATTTVSTPERRPGQYGGEENLLPNPSFEEGIRPWEPNGSAALLQLTNRFAKVGRTALRVTSKDVAAYGIQNIGAVVNPVRGDLYEFSAWVKGD